MLLPQDPNHGASAAEYEDAGRNHFTRLGGTAFECAASGVCLSVTVTICVLVICQNTNLKLTYQNCILREMYDG